MARLVLVLGSTALAECPSAMAEIDLDLQVLCQELAREGDALLVTSGAVGPEVQAEMVARIFDIRAVAYLHTGERREGTRVGRWHETPLSGTGGVSLRDRELIRRAQGAAAGGFDVEVVAYLDADAGAHSSSARRVRLAEEATLRIVARTWRRERGVYRRVRGEAVAA